MQGFFSFWEIARVFWGIICAGLLCRSLEWTIKIRKCAWYGIFNCIFSNLKAGWGTSPTFSSVRNTYLIRISACFQKTSWFMSSLFDFMINYHGLSTRLPLPLQLFNQHESHRKHKRLLISVALFRNGRPSLRFVMYHIQVTDVIINYIERRNGIILTVVQTKRASMG